MAHTVTRSAILPVTTPAPGGEGRPVTGAVVALTSWSLAVVSLAALALARPPVTDGLWFFAVDVVVAAVYGTVAGVVLARRRHVVPYVLALTAVGGGLAAVGYAWSVLAEAGRAAPGVALLAPLQGIAWVPGTLALFLVVPWLVRDHPLGRAAWGLAAGAALTAWVTLSRVVGIEAGFSAAILGVVAVGLVAAAETAWRAVRGPVAERPGLGWLATGTAVMAVSFLPVASPTSLGLPVWLTPSLHLLAQAVFPAAVLVAVLRQRLWGIDLAVSRAVVAGLLGAGLLGLYVAVVAAAAQVLPGEGLAQVLAAAAVAVAVQPARLLVQRRVHRLVHGDAADPARAVRALGRGLAGPDDDVVASLAGHLAAALRLESVRVVLPSPGSACGTVLAAHGTPTSAPVTVPLRRGGEDLGHLEVTTPPGEALDARSLTVLDDLAGLVGAAVALEAARQRLTSVRLEERRRIRRELHDGLGPALAGIRLGLQGARNLVEADPVAAGHLLAALQGEVEQRVDDVRALSHSLLPPALDELGLGPALDELAARHAGAGFTVTVEAAGLPALPAPVAAAAYGIAAEAVRNAARHSGAGGCRVAALVDGGGLVVEVADEGRGIAPGSVVGVGTQSMRERAAELGGSVETGTSATGTVVRARIPLQEDA